MPRPMRPTGWFSSTGRQDGASVVAVGLLGGHCGLSPRPQPQPRGPRGPFPPAPGVVLMVDRYSAYKAMVQVKLGNVVLVFCWSHVRRDFVKVGKAFPEHKEWALAWLRRIRDLYRFQRQRLDCPRRHAELSPPILGCGKR